MNINFDVPLFFVVGPTALVIFVVIYLWRRFRATRVVLVIVAMTIVILMVTGHLEVHWHMRIHDGGGLGLG